METKKEFYCNLCDYGTNIKCNYNKHLISSKHIDKELYNYNANKYVCNICKKTFCKKYTLEHHIKICRGTSNILQCGKCKKIFNKSITRYVHEKKCINIISNNKDCLEEKIKKLNAIKDSYSVYTGNYITNDNVISHIKTEDNDNKQNVNKNKKIPISSTVKRLVWNTYIGESIGKSKCLCCNLTDITQLSFNCGHIIAESKGGKNNLDNLRPICQNCNSSMGTKNMNDFINSLK